MRQLSAKFLLMMSVMAALFFACGDDDDGVDILPPTISAADDASVAVGATVDVSFSVTAPGGFATASVAPNDASFATASIRTQGTVGENNTTVVVTVTGVAEGQTAITLTVEDQQDQQATDDVTITVTAAPEEPGEPGEPNEPTVAATVVDTIANRDDLTSLEAAVTAAGLVETLQGAGPFTIFAPNDAAFTALIESIDGVSNLDELVAAIGADSLAAILQAHVVSGSLPADSLAAQSYPTLQGAGIEVAIGEDGTVTVDGATVVETNLLAENGVVHIIDAVINLPEEDNTPAEPVAGTTVVDTVASRDDLSSLEAALTATELVEPLRAEGPFTIFAPNNEAFAALLQAQEVQTLEALINKLGMEAVADILQAHVVVGSEKAIMAADILDKAVYNTLNGATLTAGVSGQTVTINGAEVIETDLVGSNGVVHIIDEVVNLSAASDGSNGFTVTIQNVSSASRYFQHGLFNTPVGAQEAGAIATGEAYEFSFHAGPNILPNDAGTRLSFVSMLQPSQDHFLGTNPNGILLYNNSGQPITGDITNQVKIWDAGTKFDNGDADPTPGSVQQVAGVNAANLVTVTISNQGTLFTVRIENVSTDNTFSPGVFGIHTVNGPIFATNRGVGNDGLKELAEAGDPSVLDNTMAANEGLAVPLSAGVFAIHGNDVRPFFTTGQANRTAGVEALAEEGNAGPLATTLAGNVTAGTLKASGQFDPISPGESISFDVDGVAAGDRISIMTMMVQSNDIVYASGELGIPLFLNNGNPFNGNARQFMVAYDVGTEVDEFPGAGLNQPIRSAPQTNVGAPENGNVQRVLANGQPEDPEGFVYRPVEERIIVTITPK